MPTNIATIKAELEGKIGERVLLTQQIGRKRVMKRQGVLSDTFPSIFVVELDQDENKFERISYSYSDVLTESVEIEFE